MTDHRIIAITLDESTIVKWNATIENERQIAVNDLLEENSFQPLRLNGDTANTGPYKVHLSINDGRLVFDLKNESDTPLDSFYLSITPFRKIIKDYFVICESYYNALKSATPLHMEAIDMGRRGIHNEGGDILKELLRKKALVDFDTARRLFTLICVLHLKG